MQREGEGGGARPQRCVEKHDIGVGRHVALEDVEVEGGGLDSNDAGVGVPGGGRTQQGGEGSRFKNRAHVT